MLMACGCGGFVRVVALQKKEDQTMSPGGVVLKKVVEDLITMRKELEDV